jgi:hypothetical protein
VTLQEELLLLDKEFEAFNDELFSLEDPLKNETNQTTSSESHVQLDNPTNLITETEHEISLNQVESVETMDVEITPPQEVQVEKNPDSSLLIFKSPSKNKWPIR